MEARRKITGRGGRERVSEQTEKGGREGERDRGREQEKEREGRRGSAVNWKE